MKDYAFKVHHHSVAKTEVQLSTQEIRCEVRGNPVVDVSAASFGRSGQFQNFVICDQSVSAAVGILSEVNRMILSRHV